MCQTVECPCCGAENDMTDVLSDGLSSNNTTDWECEECGEEFEIQVEFEPSFSASKIEYEACDNCGKDTRDVYRKGRVFPFPEKLEAQGSKFCHSCWSKAASEEMRA